MATHKAEMFDGKNYEGPGISPDITIQNSIQGIEEGKDIVLEKALELLNN